MMSEECKQCDTCSENCPIIELTGKKGLYRIFFEDDVELWDCSSCFRCEAACPNKLSVRDAIFKKRRSLKERMPSDMLRYFTNILKFGNVFGEQELSNEKRKKLGLELIDFEKIKFEMKKLAAEIE